MPKGASPLPCHITFSKIFESSKSVVTHNPPLRFQGLEARPDLILLIVCLYALRHFSVYPLYEVGLYLIQHLISISYTRIYDEYMRKSSFILIIFTNKARVRSNRSFHYIDREENP